MAPPAVLVIFGASGDLTSRKLMPALAELSRRGHLPSEFAVVGVARTEMDDADFQRRMTDAVEHDQRWRKVAERFRYVTGDYGDRATYRRLAHVLGELDESHGSAAGAGSRVYYFASPPSTFPTLVTGLRDSGLNRPPRDGDGDGDGKGNGNGNGDSFVRVIVEKPFGHDLGSAARLDDVVHSAFDEHQVYRIDHYLGKETVQNLLALRFANAIFEPIWNRRYVEYLEITVAESLGVGHRGGFYEEAGALRDIVQNHMMQVLSLTMMEAPVSMDADGIRDEKVKLLRAVVPPEPGEVGTLVIRGQYDEGLVDGEKVVAYRQEEGVDPHSDTETYLAMRLQVENWRWAGVPVYVRTGKRLPKQVTEVVMHFRRAPHLPFAAKLARRLEANSLIVRIQPHAGISLRFGAKVPGQAFAVRTASMDFDYTAQFTEEDLDGYERLLLDALLGDQTLFIRSDEVAQAWRIVDPILAAWDDPDVPLARYQAGTWGPTEADRLLDRFGHAWRSP